MQNNNKGVTLITLVLTILLLSVLAGVSINTGFSVVKDIRMGRIISNMVLVKAKVEVIDEQYEFSGNEADLVGKKEQAGIDFIQETEKEMIEKNAESYDFNTWNWYCWDSDTLKSQGLDSNMLSNDECFYVNYEHGEIVYSKGTSHNNEKYYSLSGLNEIYKND